MWRWPTMRFPVPEQKSVRTMPGYKTTLEVWAPRNIAPIRVAFRQRNDVGTRRGYFAVNGWAMHALFTTPLSTLREALAGTAHDRGRCGSHAHSEDLPHILLAGLPGALRLTPELGQLNFAVGMVSNGTQDEIRMLRHHGRSYCCVQRKFSLEGRGSCHPSRTDSQRGGATARSNAGDMML